MKAYVLNTGRKIEPFGDYVGEILLFNKPLRELQQEFCEKCGLEVEFISDLKEIRETPALLIFDNLYFSLSALEAFLKRLKKEEELSVFSLKKCLFTDLTSPIQNLREIENGNGERGFCFNLFYLPNSNIKIEDLGKAKPLVIEPKEAVQKVELPEHYLGKRWLEFPITSQRAMHICHWAHIIWANLYGIIGQGMEAFEKHKFLSILALLRAFTFNKWKLMAKLVKKGKKCDIHPKAIIEASVIGNGVKIGAGAIVRASIIGDNVRIDDNVHCELCVVGDGAVIHKKSVVAFCTIYPEAIVAHRLLQFSLLGYRVITTGGGYVLDLKFKDTIKVEHEGKLVDTGSRYLGCCFGHDVVMGTGIWINSGREIPNGYLLVRHPDYILSKIPKGLPKGKPLAVKDGTLIEL